MPPRDQAKAEEAVRAEEDGKLEEAVKLYREAGYELTAQALQEVIDEDEAEQED